MRPSSAAAVRTVLSEKTVPAIDASGSFSGTLNRSAPLSFRSTCLYS